MRPSYQDAIQTFQENNGILRSSQAHRQGVDRKTLAEMLAAGLLVHETRGVYRLAELPALTNPDLTTVAIRAPQAVVCLISALAFHNLTTQIPSRVYLALLRGYKKVLIDYPPTDYVWLSEPAYSAGIEVHQIDGVPVKIYCAEKTVADCFKFRNKIGTDIAVEALKDYLRRPHFEIEKLIRYARDNHVYQLMRPYIQGLIALLFEIR